MIEEIKKEVTENMITKSLTKIIMINLDNQMLIIKREREIINTKINLTDSAKMIRWKKLMKDLINNLLIIVNQTNIVIKVMVIKVERTMIRERRNHIITLEDKMTKINKVILNLLINNLSMK